MESLEIFAICSTYELFETFYTYNQNRKIKNRKNDF